MNNVDAIIEEKLGLYIEELKENSKKLSEENVEKLYVEIAMTLFLHDIENIPCFNRIKSEKINGITYEIAQKMHRRIFSRLYNKNKKFIYVENLEAEILDQEIQLQIIKDSKDNFIEVLKALSSVMNGLELKDLVNAHRKLANTILNKYFDKEPLELSEEEKINLIDKFEKYFIKVFGKHYGMLGCGKLKK